MSFTRRHFLRVSLASIFYASHLYAVDSSQKVSQFASLDKWLELFLPKDHQGDAGNHKQVLERFNQLMLEKDFAKGIKSGFSALEEFEPTLKTQQDLDLLMKKNMSQSKFLTALYELLLESYYGQECGWIDLNLVNPLIK